MSSQTVSMDISGRQFTFETGRLAQQATSAVLGRLGETMVLATVVESAPRKDLDYFPLTVEYVEKLYAGGRIKGSRWVKREGRPSDEAILKARLIDRSIRPLFPKNYKNEVQIVVTVLSVDGENDPDILAMNTVSAALSLSSLPWQGPIAALRIGMVNPKKGETKPTFLINPTFSEMDFSELDLVVSQTKDKIVMLEAGAAEVSEVLFLEAILAGEKDKNLLLAAIGQLTEKVGKPKREVAFEEKDKELIKEMGKYKENILALVARRAAKEEQGDDLKVLAETILSDYEDKYEKENIIKVLDELFKNEVREKILKEEKRPDGRGLKDIRPLEIEVGVLPRTHGSAIFRRGQTQVLSITTLGAPSLEQYLERMEGEETKRYMHHYYMPPYSVGETGRIGFPSRREVGHGALAERALLAVLPSEEEFPYTIRVVSETLSSNGSTSMASTCGSTLSLMDAGVPIKEPVAGIAMGLIAAKDGKDFKILTDIVGIEDFCGDMDFKVAGTKNGITAVQLDVKIDGLTQEMIKQTLEQAKEARMFILEKMREVIAQPRQALSRFAPKVKVLHIDTEKIGEVIGPGGRVIRQIMAATNTTLDVSDDGSVSITGTSEEEVEKAVAWVGLLTREIKVNEEFEGEVKRILPFGAFVEMVPGKEGLVHISQMATGFVNDPNDVVKIGQKVKVRVMEIDEQGRINLSMLFGEAAQKPRRERHFIDRPRRPQPFGYQRRPRF